MLVFYNYHEHCLICKILIFICVCMLQIYLFIYFVDIDQTYGEMTSKHDFKPTTGKNNPTPRQFPFVQTPGTSCPSRILDLSTLKRQPKLL